MANLCKWKFKTVRWNRNSFPMACTFAPHRVTSGALSLSIAALAHFCSLIFYSLIFALFLFIILSLSHRTHTVHTSHLIHRASCIVLHNIHIAFALRIREIDLRFYLCTFFKCIVYFALTVDWKLEIDKFNIIDVIFSFFILSPIVRQWIKYYIFVECMCVFIHQRIENLCKLIGFCFGKFQLWIQRIENHLFIYSFDHISLAFTNIFESILAIAICLWCWENWKVLKCTY